VAPAPSPQGHLSVTSVTEQVRSALKLALYAAFLVTIPAGLCQMWAFVAPALLITNLLSLGKEDLA
jgi:Sec-independent protein secretion pathway component TatC